MATLLTTLFLRHGGQFTTEAPSQRVITTSENAAVKVLHGQSTEFFHSDYAHTDYVARSQTGGASWSTPPLAMPCKLRKGQMKTTLWIGTNAKATVFLAQLSRWSEAAGWVSLCGATCSTLSRRVKAPQLPGKGMIAVMANGGFSVELPFEMTLPEDVELGAGDMLRIDLTGGPQAPDEAEADERIPNTPGVVHRVWHSSKWASSVELEIEVESKLDLKFVPSPEITQPAP
jgi:hypothetical protein